MNKIKMTLVGLFCLAFLLTGCTTNSTLAYTYNVDSGDKVKVTLDRSNGYAMNTGNPFTVSIGGEDILTCQFLSKEGYEYYDEILTPEILASQDGRVIETGESEKNSYVFYTIQSDHVENNFFVKLNDQTSIIIGSLAAESDAKECFDSLSFEIIE